MSIVKLSPSYKDYLWGGTKLKTNYDKQTEMNPLAESWEISTHPDGPSYINDTNETLAEYIEVKGREVLGSRGQNFSHFPILVKFIDANRDLSIQVHPKDDYALIHENEYGKTEMWYVLEATPEASVYFGVKEDMSRQTYREAIENNTILDVLNRVSVKQGDVIFVEAGTIHAIGAGIVVCEIQQNSNTTYRVYDFNRKDKDGNLRELHIDQAIEVSNLGKQDTDFKAQGEWRDSHGYRQRTLVTCPYFTTEEVELDSQKQYSLDGKSFEGIVVVEGTLELMTDDTEIKLNKGESAFIDAATQDITVSGKGRYLSIRV